METGKETSMYTVSNHAKERYAERCKDRDSRLEITPMWQSTAKG